MSRSAEADPELNPTRRNFHTGKRRGHAISSIARSRLTQSPAYRLNYARPSPPPARGDYHGVFSACLRSAHSPDDMMPTRRAALSPIDLKILQRLHLDARISNVDLAKAVGLSPSACHERMKAIERSGVIRRYIADYDLSKISRPITVFVEVNLKDHREADMQRFIAAIRKKPEVTECFIVAGRIDFLLRVVCRDVEHYNDFNESLSRDDLGVEKALGHIVLVNSKIFSGYPLETLLETGA